MHLASDPRPDDLAFLPGIEGAAAIFRTTPYADIADNDPISIEQDELLRAIRTVAQVEAIFSPGIAQRVLGYLSARRRWQRARPLTNWHRASVRFSKGSPKDRPTARS